MVNDINTKGSFSKAWPPQTGLVEYPAHLQALWDVHAAFLRKFPSITDREDWRLTPTLPGWLGMTRQLRALAKNHNDVLLQTNIERLKSFARWLPPEAIFRELTLLSHQHLSRVDFDRQFDMPDPRSLRSQHPDLLIPGEVPMT